MITFSTNSSAKKIVQRFRLRSTSEPPPKGPAPVPTPNAPDRPASLPEWSRISSITTTARTTCTPLRIASMRLARLAERPCGGAPLAVHPALGGTSLDPVEPAQDLDRLGAQVTVHGAPVLAGKLAHAVVELGVADLAVLRLLCRAQLGQQRLVVPLLLAPAPQRQPQDDRHERGEHEQGERVLHRRLRARELLAHAGRVERAHPPQPRLGRGPRRDQSPQHRD